jgi:hypothetical protein
MTNKAADSTWMGWMAELHAFTVKYVAAAVHLVQQQALPLLSRAPTPDAEAAAR